MKANTDRILRKSGVVLCLGLAAMLCAYFSLFLFIGSAVVIDPRDIFVVFGGLLAGPAGGAVVGLLAGFAGSDPVVEIPMYIVSGLASGLIGRLCIAHRAWVPSAALGLGCGYILAGAIMMVTSWFWEVAALAFRSLIMINLAILIVFIIDSLDPGIFQWEENIIHPDKEPDGA